MGPECSISVRCGRGLVQARGAPRRASLVVGRSSDGRSPRLARSRAWPVGGGTSDTPARGGRRAPCSTTACKIPEHTVRHLFRLRSQSTSASVVSGPLPFRQFGNTSSRPTSMIATPRIADRLRPYQNDCDRAAFVICTADAPAGAMSGGRRSRCRRRAPVLHHTMTDPLVFQAQALRGIEEQTPGSRRIVPAMPRASFTEMLAALVIDPGMPGAVEWNQPADARRSARSRGSGMRPCGEHLRCVERRPVALRRWGQLGLGQRYAWRRSMGWSIALGEPRLW